MKIESILTFVFILMMAMAFMSCGGYVKKGEFEKQLSERKMDMEQKIQLAQDSCVIANDKADQALSAAKGLERMKGDILSTVDTKIDSIVVSIKSQNDEAMNSITQDITNRVLSDANKIAMAEDEKIKQLAKEAADKAMNAALEADQKAQEAARQAELAKELPKTKEPATFVVYFDSGKTKLKSDGITELEKAAFAIKENPNAVVKIKGHADNVSVTYSKHRSNWLLSQARADVVKKYLIETLGVSEDYIKSGVGVAEYEPDAPNDKNNKWKNRRVEVMIYD
jgi:flagellar motor protein MotB